ncbi:MAG: hypothetical protein V3V76_04230 [Candidatus Adiutricales bacterium]
MVRLAEPPLEAMSDEQRRVVEAIVTRMGRLGGPYPAMIHSPKLTDLAQQMGKFIRGETTLPRRLTELAIVIIARLWTAQTEWYAHAPLARRAGIDDSILQAIARRETPEFINQDEKLVYDFALELNENKKVSDAIYTAAVKEFGAQGVVELVGLLGFYTLVAMTLNTFELTPPDGAEGLMPE